MTDSTGEFTFFGLDAGPWVAQAAKFAAKLNSGSNQRETCNSPGATKSLAKFHKGKSMAHRLHQKRASVHTAIQGTSQGDHPVSSDWSSDIHTTLPGELSHGTGMAAGPAAEFEPVRGDCGWDTELGEPSQLGVAEPGPRNSISPGTSYKDAPVDGVTWAKVRDLLNLIVHKHAHLLVYRPPSVPSFDAPS